MRQKKYFEISNCIKQYQEATTIEWKKKEFKQCVQEINNLRDWIKNDKTLKDGWKIGSILSKWFFWKTASDIANADKHFKLKKDKKTIDDFIKIKKTNELLLRKGNKGLNKDLAMTQNNKMKEYKYIEIDSKMTAYQFINKCLEEIHNLIQNNFDNKGLKLNDPLL